MRKPQAQARMFTKKQMDEQVAMEVSRARWRWDNEEVRWGSLTYFIGLVTIPAIAIAVFVLYLAVYCPLWWFVHNASAHPEERGGGVTYYFGGSTSGTWSGGPTCDYINGIYNCK